MYSWHTQMGQNSVAVKNLLIPLLGSEISKFSEIILKVITPHTKQQRHQFVLFVGRKLAVQNR